MSEFSTVLCFNNPSARRIRSNNKLEAVEDGFETRNQSLQNEYDPHSCMTADEQLVVSPKRPHNLTFTTHLFLLFHFSLTFFLKIFFPASLFTWAKETWNHSLGESHCPDKTSHLTWPSRPSEPNLWLAPVQMDHGGNLWKDLQSPLPHYNTKAQPKGEHSLICITYNVWLGMFP